MKRILCIILALAMTFTILLSCSEKSDNTSETVTTAAATEEEDPLAERKAVADDLPDVDLDGEEWRVYAQESHVKNLFYVEDEDGEVVHDAIFYANRTVEERFNVDLVVDYSGNDDTQQPSAIQRMVSAGDQDYSLVTCHDVLGCNLSLQNTFVNLYNINYLNFDKPWWHDMEAITVLGQVYMISSDMTVFQLNSTWVIYFNKDIMNDFGIEYPYQTVLDGNWTLDKLISITKDVYTDVNGSSTDDSGDIHGFSILPNCYGWLDSMGIQTTQKDNDDILVVLQDQTKITALVEKMYDWLFNTTGARSSMENNKIENQAFMDGQYMMLYSQVGQSVSSYRFIEKLNYGLVPVPKYDENQSGYISTFMDYPFFVPNVRVGEQLDTTGLMIEALSAEGYKQIFPAYYEVALKVKYAQDDESVQMIEIINDTTRPSFSWCFENWQGLQQSLYTLILGKNSDYASYYAKTVKSAQARVKLLIKMFEKME